MTVSHFIYLVVAFFAVYVQTKSYALNAALTDTPDAHPALVVEYGRLLRVRRWLSPFIAGLTALLVMVGAFVQGDLSTGDTSPGDASTFLGLLLTAVWVMAAAGDIFIEGSYSTTDETVKGRYYIVGMALFILFTLGLGLGLSANALANLDVPGGQALAAAVVSVVMGVIAYRTLDVTAETRVIMRVYAVSVTVLLCGGLLSALGGSVHLAYIGIAYFFSDWCVGLRDFGKNVPPLLKEHILIVILILYYTVMLTSIDFVL